MHRGRWDASCKLHAVPVNPPAGQSSRPLCPSSARGRPQPPKVKNLRREAGSAAASYTPVPRPAPRAAGERLTTSSTRPSAPFRKHAASQGGGWRREGPPLLLSNHEGRSFLRDRERGGGAGGRARGWVGGHTGSPTSRRHCPSAPARHCGPGWEEEGKPQNSQKIGPAGGGQKFPSALHSWAAKRAPAAGPASDAPGLLPVLVTAPAAERAPPRPPAMQAPLHTDGSHENTYTANGRAREQYTDRALAPSSPGHPERWSA